MTLMLLLRNVILFQTLAFDPVDACVLMSQSRLAGMVPNVSVDIIKFKMSLMS